MSRIYPLPNEFSPGDVTIVTTPPGELSAPVADFSISPSPAFGAPETVSLTDTSTGLPTLIEWDFTNDGIFDATNSGGQTRVFSYSPGTYSIRMRATNDIGSSTIVKPLVVLPPPAQPGSTITMWRALVSNATARGFVFETASDAAAATAEAFRAGNQASSPGSTWGQPVTNVWDNGPPVPFGPDGEMAQFDGSFRTVTVVDGTPLGASYQPLERTTWTVPALGQGFYITIQTVGGSPGTYAVNVLNGGSYQLITPSGTPVGAMPIQFNTVIVPNPFYASTTLNAGQWPSRIRLSVDDTNRSIIMADNGIPAGQYTLINTPSGATHFCQLMLFSEPGGTLTYTDQTPGAQITSLTFGVTDSNGSRAYVIEMPGTSPINPYFQFRRPV